jgi:fatty acid desaturase
MPRERTTAWPTVALAGAMYALLLGNLALYWTAPLPLVLHVAVSALAIHLAFTVWHEGVHRNVSPRESLNDLVGVLGVFPYMAPYFLEKWFHLQHHAHLNRSGDPNLIYVDGPFWTIPLRYLRILRYAREQLAEDPRRPWQRRVDAAIPVAVVALYALAWWNGVLMDLLLLWLVPVVIAKLVMDWYINYLPHVGLPPDRYRGTRIVDVPWLTPLVLCHNYHAIHHLWPNLPWYAYRRTFERRREQLARRGVPIETRVLGHGPAARGPAGALGG